MIASAALSGWPADPSKLMSLLLNGWLHDDPCRRWLPSRVSMSDRMLRDDASGLGAAEGRCELLTEDLTLSKSNVRDIFDTSLLPTKYDVSASHEV
mmetsp:Transcript_1407/g.2900  ORF Transcript_1407/g.2900 Transcript_1407/m.2900 type:complete len:96 (-) Transcript_1407:1095-1382(-)